MAQAQVWRPAVKLAPLVQARLWLAMTAARLMALAQRSARVAESVKALDSQVIRVGWDVAPEPLALLVR